MRSSLTRLQVRDRSRDVRFEFNSAASLHCHTHHSKEILTFIPHYAAMIPVISRLFRAEMDRFLTLNERTIDFGKAWWTPPVTPHQVLDIETHQIEREFGLPALVSITDHDDIEAGLNLQVINSDQRVPISLEWTVPYQSGFFHVGVHNLPGDGAREIVTELMRHTRGEADAMDLRDLFAMLNESAGVLVVLNHPLWDIEFIGREEHERCLACFLEEFGWGIHALEINGFRSWKENARVMKLAEEKGYPVVTGGDRHGLQANTMVNLSRGKSFDEFVAEIRQDLRSEVLLMPEYSESLVARTLAVVADVLRHYPNHSLGQSRWSDRIFIELEDSRGTCALSHHWPQGGPAWVRAALWSIRMLGSRELKPALLLALARERIGYEI